MSGNPGRCERSCDTECTEDTESSTGKPRHSGKNGLGVEIEKKSNLDIRVLQVGKKLSFVQVEHLFHRLDFDDDLPLDYYVGPIANVREFSFIGHLNSRLAHEPDLIHLEFQAQARLVRRLEKATTHDSVNFDCGANDSMSKPFGFRMTE